MQQFRITTTVQSDDDDATVFSHDVAYETVPHDLPLDASAWSEHGDLEEEQRNDHRAAYLFGRYDTDYDRAAEEHYGVYITTLIEELLPGDPGWQDA